MTIWFCCVGKALSFVASRLNWGAHTINDLISVYNTSHVEKGVRGISIMGTSKYRNIERIPDNGGRVRWRCDLINW